MSTADGVNMFCSSSVRDADVPGFGAGGMETRDGSVAGAAAAPDDDGAWRPTTVGTPCCECELSNFFMTSMRLAMGLAPPPVAPKSLSRARFSRSIGGGVIVGAGGGVTDSDAICSSWPTSWKPCMDVIASWASPWLWNVIQHSWTPISNFANSPKGLKMPRMSSSVTTGLRFLMCNFRMLGPAAASPPVPALRPVRTWCVNCCRVIMRLGCGLLRTSCASARFTNKA
mmetsp:Transcript_63407/g.193924  ORF Transcript_63407/g.193924 Transcript_63407/m.193924 type:complete len:228 (-) Transcript_63407:500-1183(-)